MIVYKLLINDTLYYLVKTNHKQNALNLKKI